MLLSTMLIHSVCAFSTTCGGGPIDIVIDNDPAAIVKPVADDVRNDVDDRLAPQSRFYDEQVVANLRVQSALRSARKMVEQHQFGEAIRTLEPLLPHAGGSDAYLETLESAYRQQLVVHLRNNETEQARLIGRRLRVLTHGEPTAVNAANGTSDSKPVVSSPTTGRSDAAAHERSSSEISTSDTGERVVYSNSIATVSAVPTKAAPQAPEVPASPNGPRQIDEPLVTKTTNGAPGSSSPSQSVSGKAGTETTRKPFPLIPIAVAKKWFSSFGGSGTTKRDGNTTQAAPPKSDADEYLEEADHLYRAGEYLAALPLYEKAYAADPLSVQSVRHHWGYCLLRDRVETRYNVWFDDESVGVDDWSSLESDVQLAHQLAPKLDWCDEVLTHVRDRKREAELRYESRNSYVQTVASEFVGSTASPAPSRTIPRPAKRSGAWSILETTNFRIYHRDPQFASQVAKAAEQARRDSHTMWFGDEPISDWNPRCDIVLYPNGHEYSQATGVGPQSPGHTMVQNDNGRIASRKIQLRTDDPSILRAVLPHEVTHVVLAGGFGRHAVPRWADEGMAVLTEPRSLQEAHLSNLYNVRRTARGFTCAEMMSMTDYPPEYRKREFYAHGVGLCRYLVEIGGSRKLVEFIREAFRTNSYEHALQQVYGLSGFAELETGFSQFAAPSTATALR